MTEQPPIDQRIRERAFQLWEQAGRPQGRHEEFWDRAKAKLHDELLAEQERVLDRSDDAQG